MIDNAIRKEVYDGDGSTVEWAIPFDYSDTEQVKLYTITDDVETEITTNFSINNNVITYPVNGAPVPEGTKVLVIRKTPLNQLESSVETPFTSADVERALDKLTCEVQEVKEDVDRALKSPEWSKESAGNLLEQVEQKVETLESAVSTKQDTLVSGANIKTVNNQSLLGSGNIAINTDGYLPKVFDGEQVISPKTTGRYNSIVFDSKDDRCKFEIRKTLTGFALYTHKKVNGLWQNVAEISSNVEDFHRLLCSYSENGKTCRINVADNGFNVGHYTPGKQADLNINCQTGATFNGKRILTEDDLGDLGDQVAGIEAKIPAEARETNQLADKQFVRDLTSALNFVQWFDALPETGERKYIYAVPREETDTDGKRIAALYLWDGSAWRGVGAFSLNIDPDTLATKTELAEYVKLSTKGIANGVASLDASAKVPENQLPDVATYQAILREW